MIRLFSLSLLITALAASAREIILSPEGEISNPQAALIAARNSPEPVKIIVRDGIYLLRQPLEFSPGDSDITWQAASGAEPVFDGGMKISGWQKTKDGLWKAELPKVREGRWNFDQLWVNGHRATRARTPNKGFFNLSGPAEPGTFPDVQDFERQTFQVFPEEYPIFKNIPDAELDGVLVTVTAKWSVSQCRIQALDNPSQSVRIKSKATYPFSTEQGFPRYFIENFRAALDSPGEWFLDEKNGIVLYQPLPGQEIDDTEITAPVSGKFMTITGARNLTFEGIRFHHSADPYAAEGLFDRQAAVSSGAAIEIEDSSGIRFENCEIAHTGNHGIWFRNGCTDSSILRCHIHDLGAGGIRIGDTSRPPEEKVTRNITVDNCIIRHGSRRHPSACGIALAHAAESAITHCEIADFLYSGVSFGWNWGYGESVCHDNLLENCHIHHIGWAYLSDMGGFYNLGSAPGTIIRGNHIHHIASNHYGGWGLYTDEGSTNVLMENNLVHDTSDSGFHQHYGFHDIVRNNIFAFGKNGQIQRSRSEPQLAFVYERNIVLWDSASPLLHGTEANWKFHGNRPSGYPRDNLAMRRNLYWRTDGKMPEKLAGKWSWQEWQKMGRDSGSLFADPLFNNVSARDFRLKQGSPAAEIGFKPWDLTLAGVRKNDDEWTDLANGSADFPDWEKDAKPWPERKYGITLQDFESARPGTLSLPKASISGEGKGESIAVSDEVSSPIPTEAGAKPSKHSLRIRDSPDLSKNYLPILNLSPDWGAGKIHVSFDAVSQEGADWFFESRSSTSGEFAAGPILYWRGGAVFAGNGDKWKLAEIPAGEWFRAEISATTGTGKWSVTITRQNGTETEFPDLPCKASWSESGYLLWSSIGHSDASFYIDNLSLTHQPE